MIYASEAVNGAYHYTSKCATPGGILYSRENPGSTRIYHMVHSNRTTAADDDRWVLTNNPQKMEPDEHCDIICVFKKDFVHFMNSDTNNPRIVPASLPGMWMLLQPGFKLSVMKLDPTPKIQLRNFLEGPSGIVDCQSTTPFILMRLDTTDMHYPVKSLFVRWANAPSTTMKATWVGGDEPWISVADHEAKDALALVSFAVNKIKQDAGTKLAVENIVLDADNSCHRCLTEVPRTLHHWYDDGSIERVEDEQMAVQMDRDRQNKPPSFEVQAWRQPNGGDGSQPNILNMRISLNPTSLAHKAFGHITRDVDPMSAFVRSVQGSSTFNVQFGFWEPSLKELLPFRQSMQPIQPDDYSLGYAAQPPNFTRNGMMLRRDQWEAVQWMLLREQYRPFVEREVEECILPSVNVRLSAVANVENHALGGVLAHDIGYGKTIVTLGLIDFTKSPENEAKSIRQRVEWLKGHSLVHLKATLVIVPPHIVSQWAREAAKFVGRGLRGRGNGLLTIYTITKPDDVVREKMVTADIVIVSSTIVCSDKILEKLAAVSKLPSIHRKKSALKGRDYQDWYSEALETMKTSGFDFDNPENTNNSQIETAIRGRRETTNTWVQKAKAGNVGSSDRKQQKTTKVPMRAANKKSTSSKSNAKDATSKSNTKDPEQLDVVEIFKNGRLLEMYTYQRVVFDEFSYENTPVATFFQNLVASAKWILSGTPPTANLRQVCDIGKLLNVHVARVAPSMPGYFPNITVGPVVSEQTDGEQYRSYTESSSAQLALDRHLQAQYFIGHFFRKNKTHLENVNVQELICFAPMQPQEVCVYNLTQQALYQGKWDANEMPCHTGSLVRNILDKEKVGSAGSKVKSSGKSIWAGAIDALLVLASVSAQYSLPAFQVMKWIDAEETLTFGRISQLAAKTSSYYLDHCSVILASQFDMMMYLADAIEKDDTPRNSNWKAKEEAYMGHMRDIISIFEDGKERDVDNRECVRFIKHAILGQRSRNALPYNPPPGHNTWDFRTWSGRDGGPAAFDQVDWWLLRATDEFPDEEIHEMKNRWINPETDGPVTDKREIIEIIRAKQLDSNESAHQCMALALGLKKDNHCDNMLARLQRHLNGKSTKEDFEFGIQLPHERPQKGKTCKPRGQKIDETLNCFMLVIQSIQAGIKITTEAWRRQIFAMKSNCLQNGQGNAYNYLPTRCSKCLKVIKDIMHGFQSIACGHTLCRDCYNSFSESGIQECPVKCCTAMSRGSYMPWDTFVDQDPEKMVADLSTTPSAKVLSIEQAILKEVAIDEKVLIFTAYGGIKEELRAYLYGHHANHLGVYMTNGIEGDSKTIDAFKGHQGKAVLIQSLMSSESAGTNLTEANHVMFAGVLFTDTENYDMYMQQAKGRVIRYGQTRTVHVYHFVSPATIEFDIINKRQNGRIRNWNQLDGRVPIPVPQDVPDDPRYPLRYRPWLDEAPVEKLLRSVEFEEFESR